jgi:hypothetical protein
MMKRIAAVFGVLVVGAALTGSPALAKKNPCTKATGCPAQIKAEFKACKQACAKKDRACKRGCLDGKKAQVKACKAATNPTPPTCSPSAAFLNE